MKKPKKVVHARVPHLRKRGYSKGMAKKASKTTTLPREIRGLIIDTKKWGAKKPSSQVLIEVRYGT